MIRTGVTEGLRRAGSLIGKDPLSFLLALSSIVLAVLFFSLLNSANPSAPGMKMSLTDINNLSRHNLVARATLLDHDSRVVVNTRTGGIFWAAYPKSDAETAQILRSFTANKVNVTVDQQSWKSVRQIVVQFLIPILLLVTLFAFFARLGES